MKLVLKTIILYAKETVDAPSINYYMDVLNKLYGICIFFYVKTCFFKKLLLFVFVALQSN